MSTPLEIAKTQIGVTEDPIGSNWGTKVREYLAAVSILSPAPWCAAFVVWCFRQASLNAQVIPSSGSTTFLLNWAREKGKIVTKPQPGDVFLLLRAGRQTAFHCGIVGGVGMLYFYTVEGNSNNNGSVEGYEVVRHRRRLLFNRVAFLRLTS